MLPRMDSGVLGIDRTVAFVVVPQSVGRMCRVESDADLEAAAEVHLSISARVLSHLLGWDGGKIGSQRDKQFGTYRRSMVDSS